MRQLFRRSVAGQITRLTLLVCAVALLLACTAFLAYDQFTFRGNLVRTLSAQAQIVGENSVSAILFDDPTAAAKTLQALHSSPDILSAAIFTPDGKRFAHYLREGGSPLEERPAVSPGAVESISFAGGEVVLARVILVEDEPVGTVYIRAHLRELDRRFWRYVAIAGLVLALSLFAALALSAVVRRAIADPIISLAGTARAFSRDRDYSRQAQPTGTHDEVDTLIHAFNEMLSEIQRRERDLETERARLAAAVDGLQQAHERLTIAHLTAKMGDWEWNVASQRLALSPEAERNHGFEPGAFDGRLETFLGALHPDYRERVLAAFTRAVRDAVEFEVDYPTAGPAATARWTLSKANPQRRDGVVEKLIGVSMDITTLKKAQAALIQSEKLAAAGRLAATISHEINNPLEAITNLLYLAGRHPQTPDEARRYIDQAEQELRHVSQIATQTLRFHRQSARPAVADMRVLLDSVLAIMQTRLDKSQAEVVRDFTAEAPLLCFEGELRQVFTNVIGNALDAIAGRGGGGKLILRVRRLRDWRGSSAVRVTVADNGSGMSRETLARIFEPFYSTKGNLGTGLGLWVTQEIISKHKGVAKVRSQEGRGTVFTVGVPAAGATVENIADHQRARRA